MRVYCRTCLDKDQLEVSLLPLPAEEGTWVCPHCGTQYDRLPEPTMAEWLEAVEVAEDQILARRLGLVASEGRLLQGRDAFWDGHEAPVRRRR